MVTSMKAKASKPPVQNSCFTPAIPQEQATAFFIKENKATSDAQNNYLREFLTVVKFISENNRTLTLSMVTAETRKLELPFLTVQDLYKKYTDFMCSIGKLQRADSCYDETLFIIS
jgi:hypothetical protein